VIRDVGQYEENHAQHFHSAAIAPHCKHQYLIYLLPNRTRFPGSCVRKRQPAHQAKTSSRCRFPSSHLAPWTAASPIDKPIYLGDSSISIPRTRYSANRYERDFRLHHVLTLSSGLIKIPALRTAPLWFQSLRYPPGQKRIQMVCNGGRGSTGTMAIISRCSDIVARTQLPPPTTSSLHCVRIATGHFGSAQGTAC
jgi:hypothetical protein